MIPTVFPSMRPGQLFVGLSWEQEHGIFLGRNHDLDLAIVAFDGDGEVVDAVSMRKEVSDDGAITFVTGDNVTGIDRADGQPDEGHLIDPAMLDPRVQALAVMITSENGQALKKIGGITVFVAKSSETGEIKVLPFTIYDIKTTGLIPMILRRMPAGWDAEPVSVAADAQRYEDLVDHARVHVM